MLLYVGADRLDFEVGTLGPLNAKVGILSAGGKYFDAGTGSSMPGQSLVSAAQVDQRSFDMFAGAEPAGGKVTACA